MTTPRAQRFALLALLLAPAGLVAGCGPLEYVGVVTTSAAQKVEAAKEVDAETWAPYEYTRAVEYLHWAREVAGYSRFQLAIDYGKESEIMATKAHDLSLERQQRPGARPPAPPPGAGPAANVPVPSATSGTSASGPSAQAPAPPPTAPPAGPPPVTITPNPPSTRISTAPPGSTPP